MFADWRGRPDCQSYMKVIKEIYRDTNEKFLHWSKSDKLWYRNAACPETLSNGHPAKIGDPHGFSILWTPIRNKPKLLLCGLCVTDFGSIEENKKYLKGKIPSENIYLNANHKFGKNINNAFNDNKELFEKCVGLNLWHFQYVGSPFPNVHSDDVRKFCEENTYKIIEEVEPQIILSLHNFVAPKLKKRFNNVIELSHPSFQNGTKFKEGIKNIITNL